MRSEVAPQLESPLSRKLAEMEAVVAEHATVEKCSASMSLGAPAFEAQEVVRVGEALVMEEATREVGQDVCTMSTLDTRI